MSNVIAGPGRDHIDDVNKIVIDEIILESKEGDEVGRAKGMKVVRDEIKRTQIC
jgi:hypothetical protein